LALVAAIATVTFTTPRSENVSFLIRSEVRGGHSSARRPNAAASVQGNRAAVFIARFSDHAPTGLSNDVAPPPRKFGKEGDLPPSEAPEIETNRKLAPAIVPGSTGGAHNRGSSVSLVG